MNTKNSKYLSSQYQKCSPFVSNYIFNDNTFTLKHFRKEQKCLTDTDLKLADHHFSPKNLFILILPENLLSDFLKWLYLTILFKYFFSIHVKYASLMGSFFIQVLSCQQFNYHIFLPNYIYFSLIMFLFWENKMYTYIQSRKICNIDSN